MTLPEAIRVALAQNPEVAASGWDADAATARRLEAIGAVLPSLHAVSGYNHYLDAQRLVPARFNGELGAFSRNIFSSDLVITMPLFTGGRLISEFKAAELLQQAAEHRLSRTREELVFNVASAFFSILKQRHVIESVEFSRKALQEHVQRVQDLIEAQKATKVDLLRIQVRLADLQEQLVRERNTLQIQLRVMANLLGLEGEEPSVELVGDLTLPGPEPALSVPQGVAQAYVNRGDYLAARATVEAQAKNVDAARAAYWPTVAMQGSYGWRWAAQASDLPEGIASQDDVARLGVLMDIPLFEGGRITARVREQRSRLAAAQERLRQLELQIRLDVETALLNMQSARERIEATQTSIEQAKESLRIEREKYDVGKGTTTDVLDAQSALLTSQTAFYRALSDYRIAEAQLRLATGAPMP